MALLKEFDLTLPGDKERKRLFQLQIRCVTALYARLFPTLKTRNCWKVLVECTHTVMKEQYLDLSGVYLVQIETDVERFFSLSNIDKKVWALETLQTGISRLLEQTSWPAEPFWETYNKIQDMKLVNRWIWKKPIHSPSRKLVAEVMCEHGVHSCDISIIVHDRNQRELKRETLISELPHEFAYARHLGVLAWESETRIVLRNKPGDRTWHLDL